MLIDPYLDLLDIEFINNTHLQITLQQNQHPMQIYKHTTMIEWLVNNMSLIVALV